MPRKRWTEQVRQPAAHCWWGPVAHVLSWQCLLDCSYATIVSTSWPLGDPSIRRPPPPPQPKQAAPPAPLPWPPCTMPGAVPTPACTHGWAWWRAASSRAAWRRWRRCRATRASSWATQGPAWLCGTPFQVRRTCAGGVLALHVCAVAAGPTGVTRNQAAIVR